MKAGSYVEKDVEDDSGVRAPISSDLERASQSMKRSRSVASCTWSLQLIIISDFLCAGQWSQAQTRIQTLRPVLSDNGRSTQNMGENWNHKLAEIDCRDVYIIITLSQSRLTFEEKEEGRKAVLQLPCGSRLPSAQLHVVFGQLRRYE